MMIRMNTLITERPTLPTTHDIPDTLDKQRGGRERRKNHERLRSVLTCATTETDETPTVRARREVEYLKIARPTSRVTSQQRYIVTPMIRARKEGNRTFEARATNFTRRVACRATPVALAALSALFRVLNGK